MKILVTGGAGYIGSWLVKRLLELHDVNVTVVDNLLFNQTTLLEHCHKDNFRFIRGDVRDHDKMREIVAANEVIINLAGYVGVPICERNPRETNEVNYEWPEFLASILTDQFVIQPTTNSGYGKGVTTDGVLTMCDETTAINPISTYGITKMDAEAALMETGKCVSLRLATAFGVSPRMRLDLLVNDFTYRAYSDNSIILFESHYCRNYIHVQDVVGAMIFALNNKLRMVGNIYNVGLSDSNLSKMELCEIIKKQVPTFSILESQIATDPDQRNYIVSNDKIEHLGWKPEFSLDDGIAELLLAYTMINPNQFTNS